MAAVVAAAAPGDADDYAVLLFYKFCTFVDRAAFRDAQEALCVSLGLAGRLRVALDGLNGVCGGPRSALDAYVAATTAMAARHVVAPESFDDVDWKFGAAHAARPLAAQRLRGLKVALAREVVSLSSCGGDARGARTSAPARHVGAGVKICL